MRVITISGKARHGKDSAAEYVSDWLKLHGYSCMIVHYADLLKFILKEYYHWNGTKDEAGRELLQHIGTDIGRKKDKDFWVKQLEAILNTFFSHVHFVIIADARFPNEIEHWIHTGQLETSIKVVRPDADITDSLTGIAQQHESETALDDYTFDYTIEAKDLDELRNGVYMVMNEAIEV